MQIPTKNCLVCGNEYIKDKNRSLKDWEKSKYCSRPCINKGRAPWNKRNDFDIICAGCSQPFRKRNFRDRYCSILCARKKQVITSESRSKAMKTRKERYGYIQSSESREKIRQAFLGPRSHFWKGGISKENYRLRRTAEYKNWRTSVFERDGYKCQECGLGGKLQAHHIKSWENYPDLRFQLDNGQTLCIDCHKQTDSYARNLLTT